MKLSFRARVFAGFTLANAVLLITAALIFLGRSESPPVIQGVLMPQPKPLPEFRLLDHHGQAFTKADLKGQWHLVSYGFTHCPDICPTTLARLAVLKDRLEQREGPDLKVLFYTVDHRRDTVERMASYVPFFHEDFTGLTHRDNPDNPHLPFEKSLGIAAQLKPILDEDGEPEPGYEVAHGVTLLLIDPQGRLQAIFEPDSQHHGVPNFDPKQLEKDYVAVREYLG